MINLFLLTLLFFFLFGIFGVSKLKGTYYYCDEEHIPEEFRDPLIIVRAQDCMDYGGDWIIMDHNFDNIFEGMLTMFKVALTEGWLDIMFVGID